MRSRIVNPGESLAGAAQWLRFLAALVIVGLPLRTQVLVIGPLVGAIQADLAISHGVAGLLGSIPVLCMGMLAPLTPAFATRLGPRLGIASCVAAIGAFGLARAALPNAGTVLLATIGIGVGMAVAGPLLPMVVRARAAQRPTVGTWAYVVGLTVGGSIAAWLAVPLADGLGGWRGAVAAVSAFGLVSAAAWLWLVPHESSGVRPATDRSSLPWRRSWAWHLGLIFGAQSLLFQGTITWLAVAYAERGHSSHDAGVLLGFFNLVALLAAVAVPLLAARRSSPYFGFLVAGLLALTGTLGIATGSPQTYLFAGLLGVGLGLYFPLALAMPVVLAASSGETVSIAAFMLFVGYTLSSIAPAVLGMLRDLTGTFDVALWALVCVALLMVALPLGLRRRSTELS